MKITSKLAPLILFVLLTFTHPVLSEESPNLLFEGGLSSLIFNIDTFSIEVSDQVTDGCLASPTSLSDAMEVSLRQAGFQIQKDNPFAANIIITALGYKAGGVCFVSYSVDMSTIKLVVVPHSDTQFALMPYLIDVSHGIVSGGSIHTQSSLEDNARKAGEKIYLLISRAKDDMRNKFPSIYNDYSGSRN